MPNFRDRTGIPSYRAPAVGSPDPIVVEGHKQPSIAHSPAILMSVIWSGFLFSVLGRTVLAGVISLAAVALTIGGAFILTARRRAWKVPRLVATAEGLTVIDVTGDVHRVLWTNFRDARLDSRRVGRDQDLQLGWTAPGGERVVLSLGDTIEEDEVTRAIRERAPAGTEVSGMAHVAEVPDRPDRRE